MGRTRAYRGLRSALAEKLGARFHLSVRKAVLFLLPFVEGLLGELVARPEGSEERTTARLLVRELGLSSEELTFLLGDRADADLLDALLGSPEESAEPDVVADATPPVSGGEAGPSEPGSPAPKRAVQRSLGEFGRG